MLMQALKTINIGIGVILLKFRRSVGEVPIDLSCAPVASAGEVERNFRSDSSEF